MQFFGLLADVGGRCVGDEAMLECFGRDAPVATDQDAREFGRVCLQFAVDGADVEA